MWLLATADGESWLLDELPGGESAYADGSHNVAVNGNIAVVQSLSSAITYELP